MLAAYQPWRDNLAALDESWSAMLGADDSAGLRERIRLAAIFAACTAHTTVAQAELEFSGWIETGRLPVGTNLRGQKQAAIRTVTSWTATISADSLRGLDGWQLAALLARHVTGLGTVKASFAAALCGLPDAYCLDTHSAQHIAALRPELGPAARIVRRLRSWRLYREFGDPVFGNRDGQWAFFARTVPAFGTGGHWPYFSAALYPATRIGRLVATPAGVGRVTGYSHGMVTVRYRGGTTVSMWPLDCQQASTWIA